VKSEIARRLNLAQHLQPGYHGPRWTAEQLALLGTLPDADVAARIGRTPNAVRVMRDRLGIPRQATEELRTRDSVINDHSAAQRGKPRPASAMQAAWDANRGRKHTAEARAKMSAAQRGRGARPPKAGRPWTTEEDALVRELPAFEVVRRTGRTLQAVYSRRSLLGLNEGRTKRWRNG